MTRRPATPGSSHPDLLWPSRQFAPSIEHVFANATTTDLSHDTRRSAAHDLDGLLMIVSAHDVAAELRRRVPEIGVLKLHKLLYYAQGWHLAWGGEPLFGERIRAWASGPVVADLWGDEKHGRSRPEPHALSGDQLATIDYIVERYGRYSGKDLVRMTHLEDPWRDASENEDLGAVFDPEIAHEALRAWFERDEEQVLRLARVKRRRERTDVYSFAPIPVTAW